MEQPNIPWVYLAMVVIIFLRWLMTQFKKASQQREEMRRRSRRGWVEQPPPAEATPAPQPVQQRPEQPAQQSQPQTLQELFEQRRQAIAEAQRQAAVPPPIPTKKEPEPVEQPKPVITVPPVAVPTLRQEPEREKSQLAEVFSDPQKVRNAIILKEILDKPKGFDL